MLIYSEELFKWQEELYASEQYAVSGKPILDKERDKLVADYLEPNKYQQQLEEVRAYKQKLLEKVEWAAAARTIATIRNTRKTA
ncbi:hypothetical protein NIES2101_27205 [Calothrix sp. HK-06]|nr:hypothetical protein NIES2101_27205 [Calothrix sp. HK-06]